MILCHNQGDFGYRIHLNGESFTIVEGGTEIEDSKANQILLHYGNVITKFEKKKKIKED